jgi:hypothetical protein
MLWTIAVILIALWVVGKLTKIAVGGFINVLLVLALAVILFAVFGGGHRL